MYIIFKSKISRKQW